ncbi:hypothetical protein HYR99_29905 [Candidatus Poribacteria bacterium]|nr:hypothetical protein [Candidatus Poribacteria bacterium]
MLKKRGFDFWGIYRQQFSGPILGRAQPRYAGSRFARDLPRSIGGGGLPKSVRQTETHHNPTNIHKTTAPRARPIYRTVKLARRSYKHRR